MQIMEQYLRAESVHREGRTRQLGYRLKQLRGLHRLLLDNQVQLLKALNTDRKHDENAAGRNYRIILNVVATEATRLYKKYKNLEKQPVDIISSSSVLIVGDSRDPLGSIVCPLTFAISAGSCALFTMDNHAPAVQASLSVLIPQYLDREAFALIDVPLLKTLESDFKTVVLSGRSFPLEPKKRMNLVERQVGLNVLCHVDNSSNAVPDCATALMYSRSYGDGLAKIDVVLILSTKLEALKACIAKSALSTEKHPLRIREETLDYLSNLRRHDDSTGLVLIGVSSTEEVLLRLNKSSVRRFTYFGDQAYGSYMLKFLPNVNSGSVNTYHASEFYNDISAATFESSRTVTLAQRPSLTTIEEDILSFPDLAIDYTRNTPFFVQGLIVSNYVAYSLAATACLFVGWKIMKVLS